jgi:DNA-directed RNA polymerase specialized sigma24 family protein
VRTDVALIAGAHCDPVDAIALDAAISKLNALDAGQGRIAELRCFADMRLEEIAEVLGFSLRTIKHDWATAQLLLKHELGLPKRKTASIPC